MEERRRPGLLSGVSLSTLGRAWHAPDSELSEEEAASTLFRFFRSRHIVDLRLIVFTILTLLVIYLIGIVLLSWRQHFNPDLIVTLIGPAVGIAGLIVSWAYKSASTRLGIIDLFCCEIGTLCRVGTVFDIGMHYQRAYEGGGALDEAGTPDEAGGGEVQAVRPSISESYTSQEDYFPIFAGNSRDLQLLEALVVWHITEFYTFMKATRDTQRRLAAMPPPQRRRGDAAGAPRTPWHTATLDVVYMIFLGYEAGRKAVEHLIEFEPANAENRIVILITELTCYGILLDHLRDDRLRYPRLKLRRDTYSTIAPELYRTIATRSQQTYWHPARELLPQLSERYEAALGETMDQALARVCVAADPPPGSAVARVP